MEDRIRLEGKPRGDVLAEKCEVLFAQQTLNISFGACDKIVHA
jgi:hypothetical protein